MTPYTIFSKNTVMTDKRLQASFLEKRTHFFKIFIIKLYKKKIYNFREGKLLFVLRRFALQNEAKRSTVRLLDFAEQNSYNLLFCKQNDESEAVRLCFHSAKLSDAKPFTKITNKVSNVLHSRTIANEFEFFELIRPLLFLSRNTFTLLCKKMLLPIYPDKSNQCSNYSRNRIRKQLLPTLKLLYNPQIEQAFFQFAEIVQKEQDFLAILLKSIPPNLLLFYKNIVF